MILQRQIVKALGKQIDIEDIVYSKYAVVSFHSITWMLISVIVTIYRTIPLQSSGITTAKLRSGI